MLDEVFKPLLYHFYCTGHGNPSTTAERGKPERVLGYHRPIAVEYDALPERAFVVIIEHGHAKREQERIVVGDRAVERDGFV